MSAITGLVHFNQEPISKNHMERLMNSFSQYPSDDIDVWNKENIFLGCHAQWITPESQGEKLPYYDYESQLAITADAIIDNRNELFDQLNISLIDREHIPDSKLILLAYIKWGDDVTQYLQGDFAFMIWNEKDQSLFGSRDFSGARTLYFYHDYHKFAFSTTIEALCTLPYIEKEINDVWMAEFLAIPNIVEAVDMLSTVYESIQQIPPSHCIKGVGGKVSLQRFSLIKQDEIKLKSNEEYEEAFRDVLRKAVKTKIRTFGEVGSHLSGGLDSGSIVSLAATELKKENKKLQTYSSIPMKGYMDWTPDYYVGNEQPYIEEVIDMTGNITGNYLHLTGYNPFLEIDDFLHIMEMPYKFFENSYWLRAIHEKASSKNTKILLNGARGNHSISWGSMTLTFNYYEELLLKMRWRQLGKELDSYCRNFNTGKSVVLPFLMKRIFRTRLIRQKHAYPSLIHPAFAAKTGVYHKLAEYEMDISGRAVKDLTQYRHKYYQQLYVWNKSGVVGTKLSLRYGVWDRDPTNDINVIQFCLGIPSEQYTTKGLDRSIIRRAMKGYLPNSVRLNHHKRGLQAADLIQRMVPEWATFTREINELCCDPIANKYMNIPIIKEGLLKVGKEPHPNLLFDYDFKVLTRALIVYRFLKKILN